MITLNKSEAGNAARALLFSIANSNGDHLQIKLLVAKLMANRMSELAFAATAVFDVTGDFPDIFPVLKQVHGPYKAGEFTKVVRAIRTERIAAGQSNLPVLFVDENGVAENVVFMTDFEHLRRAA